MKHFRRQLAAITTAALTAIAPIYASAQSDAGSGGLGVQGLSDAETAAAQQVIEVQTNDLINGDVDAYAQYWIEDGMLLPLDHPRIVGRDNIVDYVTANFPNGTEITYSDWAFTGREDLAVVVNNAAITLGGSGEAEQIDQFIVLRLQEDGNWLVQAAIWTFRSPD